MQTAAAQLPVWRQRPDLMQRLIKVQNTPCFENLDIVSFAGFCDTDEELERMVSDHERALRKHLLDVARAALEANAR